MFELLGVVLQSPHPLSGDHLPFRAASLMGLVYVLLIPARVLLQKALPPHMRNSILVPNPLLLVLEQ